jgi:hypothetical protein
MGLTEANYRQPEEWKREWRDILERSGRDGAFLMEIHIYVLAHVLRRPIIVYSDAVQQDSPCHVRGIYLPLEWSGTGMEWETTPLLLAYEGSHFVQLIYHLKKWPPDGEVLPQEWPLIPLSFARRQQDCTLLHRCPSALALRIFFVPATNNSAARWH